MIAPHVAFHTRPAPSPALLRLDPRTGTLRARRYRVTILSGEATGYTLPLEAPLTLGSSLDAGLPLKDSTVSRYHLELLPRGDGVRVRDLGSTNGTYIGGLRLTDAVIEEEVTLTVGTTRLRVSVEEEDLGKPTALNTFGKVLGKSPAMQQLFGVLSRVAPTESTVLLRGETGTGKELIAHAIHQGSSRRSAPFVVVDCASVAPTLIESEFFGHVRGAFTGATSDRDGAFLSADGGTVFLDEIGELPLELQPKLLRVLEAGTVRRVGDDQSRIVNVRVIAASHRDLEKEVEANRFRRDLFFRLSVVPVEIPPLRARREDIAGLARHFAAASGRKIELPGTFLRALEQHRWPGNVRELRNVVERAIAMYGTAEALALVSQEELTEEVFGRYAEMPVRSAAGPALSAGPAALPEEHQKILDALQKFAGNQTLAARELGMSRGTLLSRLDAYGIPRPRKTPARAEESR